MTTVAEFLLARIAEDEAVAKAATQPPWRWHPAGTSDFSDADSEHVIRHDPARVLAECEAKRWIVEHEAPGPLSQAEDGAISWQYVPPVLALLALPYADHPDYDKEWRP